jgi:hypothetical protein
VVDFDGCREINAWLGFFYVNDEYGLPRENLVPFVKDGIADSFTIQKRAIAAVQITNTTGLGAAIKSEVFARHV